MLSKKPYYFVLTCSRNVFYFKITDTIGPISILCGNGMSVPKETRTNIMYVEFSSNGVVSFTGFNMSYGQIQSKFQTH